MQVRERVLLRNLYIKLRNTLFRTDVPFRFKDVLYNVTIIHRVSDLPQLRS